MIPRETINQIIESARVEEVIGEFISLKKRGVNMIGLCPFHNEKTPSFTVSPSKGIYKCFGCGKAGSSINFLMEHEQFTYPEALKYLAKKYNVEIEEIALSPEAEKEQEEKESLFAVTLLAQQFFSESMFQSEEGKALGLKYFDERGYKEDTIRKFDLGFSPSQPNEFSLHAKSRGYKSEYLVKTGLSIERGATLFDRFSGRIMFPIHSLSGRILGFGGRILSSDKNKPKYINSPESDIYHKSKILYGLYYAKRAIIASDNCYLVEGYTDVISMHQAGYENTVASSGTSLTEDQIRLIKRYTKNITILFDGDEAGLKASFRGIDMILEQGMNVKIILFEEGEDPDSFVRKNRATDIEEFFKTQPKDFIAFKTQLLLDDAAHDPVKKAGLVKDVVKTIALIPDQIFRSVYVKECSTLLELEERVLMNELNKIVRANYSKKMKSTTPVELPEAVFLPDSNQQQTQQADLFDTEFQEKEVIRLLIMYGHETIEFKNPDDPKAKGVEGLIGKSIIDDLRADEITLKNPLYQRVMDIYEAALERNESPDPQYFIHYTDQEISTMAIDLIASRLEVSDNWQNMMKIHIPDETDQLQNSIIRASLSLKAKKIREMLNELEQSIKECSSEEELLILMKQQMKYKEISNTINTKLSRIITN
jgi:DNA primase